MKRRAKLTGFISILLIFSIAFVFYACEEFSEVGNPPTPGIQADFTQIVAIGNSLTAGFQDGALFEGAQEYSYANLIVKQINSIGGNVNFVQPLINEPGIGTRLYLKSLSPLNVEMKTVTGAPKNLNYRAPYNNLAVPGAILYDVFDTTDYATKSIRRNNPFFQIILRNRAFGPTMFHQAKSLNPTFIIFWMGNNDVLGYATSGGTKGTDPTGKLPTPDVIFQLLFRQAIDSLLKISPKVKIAVANIPDVTVIPFFTTIPWFIVDPNTGKPIPLIGVKGGSPSQLTPNDLVLLPALELIKNGYGLSPSKPLPDEYVLDANEVAVARGAIQKFNLIIDTVVANPARAGRVVKVDIYSKLNEVKDHGLEIAGFKFTTSYITGGLFSLDGIHPSSRGHAIVANEFIKAINDKFGSNIPFVNVMSIPGVQLPTTSVAGKYQLPNIPTTAFKDVIELFAGR